MTCPACGSESSVLDSRPSEGGRLIRRRRVCLACNARWSTLERRAGKVTTTASGEQPPVIVAATTSNSGAPPPLVVVSTPTNSGRGVGGVLHSGLNLTGSGPLSDLRSESDQGTDPARAKSAYSPEFIRFWAAYPKKKHKGSAWKAWQRLKPPVDLILKALAWQRVSRDWRKDGGEFIPHPERYLNATGWEDEPTCVAPRAPLAPIPSAPLPQPHTPWTEQQRLEARDLVRELAEGKAVQG